jgi:hypothetical protein
MIKVIKRKSNNSNDKVSDRNFNILLVRLVPFTITLYTTATASVSAKAARGVNTNKLNSKLFSSRLNDSLKTHS